MSAVLVEIEVGDPGDPVVVLRIGDGLVLIEVAGERKLGMAVGAIATFTVPRIRLFPTGT